MGVIEDVRGSTGKVLHESLKNFLEWSCGRPDDDLAHNIDEARKNREDSVSMDERVPNSTSPDDLAQEIRKQKRVHGNHHFQSQRDVEEADIVRAERMRLMGLDSEAYNKERRPHKIQEARENFVSGMSEEVREKLREIHEARTRGTRAERVVVDDCTVTNGSTGPDDTVEYEGEDYYIKGDIGKRDDFTRTVKSPDFSFGNPPTGGYVDIDLNRRVIPLKELINLLCTTTSIGITSKEDCKEVLQRIEEKTERTRRSGKKPTEKEPFVGSISVEEGILQWSKDEGDFTFINKE